MNVIERANRYWQCHREGQEANDNNRRAHRRQRGELILSNPYEAGSDDAKAWDAGYQYRDMVNDG